MASERGQASVELVAALPAVLLVAAIVWELALVGDTAWLCANAARAGARAALVGRDARAAVRGAMPRSLRTGLDVDERAGSVRVRLEVPLLVRQWHGPVRIGATARLGDAG